MIPDTQSVWEQFSAELRRFISRRVSQADDVEDILQDVFVKIHTRIDTLQSEDRLAAWVYQIARNTIIDYYRRSDVGSMPLIEEGQIGAEIIAESPYSQIAAGMQEMLECLPEHYRQALALSEIQGLKQQEVADRLGLSLSGAKSRVQRGRTLLLETLLECCHFEFNRLGELVDFAPRPECCRQCHDQGVGVVSGPV